MDTANPGFLGFAETVLSDVDQKPARHHVELIRRLELVLAGDCDRLMVQMPPGYAKSTYGSVLFPAYFLSRFAGAQIIAASHTASLAEHFGRQVRRVIGEHGETLNLAIARESRAAGRFSLETGGGYFAAGIRGPITGRRADLILIDDPIKSWAEAESPVYRDALYDWYRAELTARLKPNGRIVLLMARWHEDDLAGRLLQGPGAWQNLRLPALAEIDDILGRAVGEPLWPAWQDEAAIHRRRSEVGERAFAALYQQQPKPPEDALFNTRRMFTLAMVPELKRSIRAWDLAASVASAGRDPDYTVGLKIGVTLDDNLVVLDIVRFRASSGEVLVKVKETAKHDGPATMIALPRDPGQAGLGQVAMYRNELTGFRLEVGVESGPKLTRAMPAAALMDNARLGMIAAPWNDNFIAELKAFPDSHKDDQVDALSRAVNTLAMTREVGTRRMNVGLMAR